MKHYPLGDLLRVRKIRLDAALAELSREQYNVDQLQEKCRTLKEELDNYRLQMVEKKRELFDEIKKKNFLRRNWTFTAWRPICFERKVFQWKIR
jgi:flagellar biosynthesis chaperone FliJ